MSRLDSLLRVYLHGSSYQEPLDSPWHHVSELLNYASFRPQQRKTMQPGVGDVYKQQLKNRIYTTAGANAGLICWQSHQLLYQKLTYLLLFLSSSNAISNTEIDIDFMRKPLRSR